MGCAISCFRVNDDSSNNSTSSNSFHEESSNFRSPSRSIFHKFAEIFNRQRTTSSTFDLSQARTLPINTVLKLRDENLASDMRINSEYFRSKLVPPFTEVESSEEEEDVCPTCLEEYTVENPKIVTKCSHHYHLSCIYEWLERSERCPVCSRVLLFEELF